jgi:uncharacterized protein YjdB
MTRFPRRLPPALALLACTALLPACDDGTGPPENRVTFVEAVGGNSQEGTVAAALPQALVVRALDEQGNEVSGARVEWEVASGGGTIAAASETTDGEGRASATWTLGTGAGEQRVIARIGVASTTLAATALAGAATSVTLVPDQVTLDAIGATATIAVEAEDTHGNPITDRDATWTTAAPAVATVIDGTITAVGPGNTTIMATLDGVSGDAAVSVDPQPAAVLVTPQTATLTFAGDTEQFQASARDRLNNPIALPAGSFTWSSSNEAIVTVSATGLATAVAAGAAEVRAALGALTGAAQVSVVQTADSMRITPRVDTLTTAQPTTQLQVVAFDETGAPIATPQVTWSTANNTIAVVSTTGLVTAVANGTTIIRGVSGNARDSVTVLVRLNSAPQPVTDSLAATIDTQLTVAAPGLLANDTLALPAGTIASFGGGSLGGTVTTTAAGSTVNFGTGGSLTVNANGSLSFMPSSGFTGAFTFQYRVQNGVGVGDGTVVIRVGLPPTAVDDAYATTVNTPIGVGAPGVLTNDTQGFPIGTVVSFGGGSLVGGVTSYAAGSLVLFGVGGSVQLMPDGSLSFAPPTNFTGTFTMRYRVSNGLGTSDATIAITVN